MITALDKENFLQLQELMDSHPNQAVSMLKVLARFVENVNPSNVESLKKHLNENERALEDLKETKELLQTMLKEIAEIAQQETVSPGKMYTTGQVAFYFGVSITTINNWIKQGRFIGLQKQEKHKQLRISEHTLFQFDSGKRVPVSEVVGWHERQMKEAGAREMTQEEVIQVTLEDIAFFEKKYGGTYEETLGKLEYKTREQYMDASQWEYLMRYLEAYK